MTPSEADSVMAVLRHLSGDQVLDPADLMGDVEHLLARARTACGVLPTDVDEIALLDTLGQVAQRHCDSGYDDDVGEDEPGRRAVQVAPVGGEVL